MLLVHKALLAIHRSNSGYLMLIVSICAPETT